MPDNAAINASMIRVVRALVLAVAALAACDPGTLSVDAPCYPPPARVDNLPPDLDPASCPGGESAP